MDNVVPLPAVRPRQGRASDDVLVQHSRDRSGTFFAVLGGEEMCRSFACTVFSGVVADPLLRPLVGEHALRWERRLYDRLVEFWGGGEPHEGPVTDCAVILGAATAAVVAAWSWHVQTALARLTLAPELLDTLSGYFRRTGYRLLVEMTRSSCDDQAGNP